VAYNLLSNEIKLVLKDQPVTISSDSGTFNHESPYFVDALTTNYGKSIFLDVLTLDDKSTNEGSTSLK